VIVAEDIGKQYGRTRLFDHFTITIRRGQRVGIVGPNGAGKTTLLRILLGREQPDTGTVRLGAGVVPGYVAQEHESLRFDRTILDEVRSVGEAGETEVRILLACLLFRGDEVFKRIDTLSEGERVRVALAKLLVAGANLLVLDEPTNHLDIPTRERIEAALESYDGTLLLVSHDRYLLDRLSEQTIVLGGGAATLYPGNYSYAAEKQMHRVGALLQVRSQAP
jgi:ATP-binding cassette subfamily F protein 3